MEALWRGRSSIAGAHRVVGRGPVDISPLEIVEAGVSGDRSQRVLPEIDVDLQGDQPADSLRAILEVDARAATAIELRLERRILRLGERPGTETPRRRTLDGVFSRSRPILAPARCSARGSPRCSTL